MKRANWAKAREREKRAQAARERYPHPLPPDERAEARKARAHAHFHRSGDRGVSVRGAQGADSYARRNYTKVTLPRIKFLEGDA